MRAGGGLKMRLFAAFIVMLVTVSNASAQFDKFTGNTVFQAIQCDVGRFGDLATKSGIDPTLKAHVTYNYTVEKSTKVDASAGLSQVFKRLVAGPSVEVAKTWTQTGKNTLDGNFNIHPGNMEVCKRGDIPAVPVGVYKCLKDSTIPLKNGTTITCADTKVAAGTLKANGKITWIFVTAGAEGDWDIKATYDFKVEAPAKPAKPEKADQASGH
jgi:hypothetical protein